MIFDTLHLDGYEAVYRAILPGNICSYIAIHSTRLGPALGGVRFFPYPSETEALMDVRRLSEAMTYKAANANLKLGGGKAVIMGDPQSSKTHELLRAFGQFVNLLNGRYITAKDVNISVADLDIIAEETPYCLGTNRPGSSGDPSPMTSWGTFQGISAAVEFTYGSRDLRDKVVVIQGLGKVGYGVARLLRQQKAIVYATEQKQDILDEAVRELGVMPIDNADWKNRKMDIFCPCAMGSIVTPEIIETFSRNQVRIIAGAANNQLENDLRDSEHLNRLGILYAPDYVINAGGLINIEHERFGYSEPEAKAHTDKIFDTLMEIFTRSKQTGRSTAAIARERALEKLAQGPQA